MVRRTCPCRGLVDCRDLEWEKTEIDFGSIEVGCIEIESIDFEMRQNLLRMIVGFGSIERD